MKVPIKYDRVVEQLMNKGSLTVSANDLDKLMGTSLYFKRLAKRNGYKDINSLLNGMKGKTKTQSSKYLIYR